MVCTFDHVPCCSRIVAACYWPRVRRRREGRKEGRERERRRVVASSAWAAVRVGRAVSRFLECVVASSQCRWISLTQPNTLLLKVRSSMSLTSSTNNYNPVTWRIFFFILCRRLHAASRPFRRFDVLRNKNSRGTVSIWTNACVLPLTILHYISVFRQRLTSRFVYTPQYCALRERLLNCFSKYLTGCYNPLFSSCSEAKTWR